MVRTLVPALVFCVFSVCDVSSVCADDATESLSRGRQRFLDLEYGAALTTLKPIVEDKRAPRAARLEALELIAICFLVTGDEKQSSQAFALLLSLDPNYVLKHDDGSPKIRRAFGEGKKTKAQKNNTVVVTRAIPNNGDLILSIGTTGDEVREVIVFRARGSSFVATRARVTGVSQWSARLNGAADGAVYYLEARNVVGGVLATNGSVEKPLVYGSALHGNVGDDGGSQWYRRWYVWAGAAAVLAIGGGVAVWALSPAEAHGTLTPGRVTLSP